MKLIVADDESLIRASLVSMIQDMESEWDIVGEATNGEELIELVKQHKPGVVIVDIRMPKLNGLEAMRAGKDISPCTKWIILSGFSDFAYAQEALKLGASEYLLKPVDPVELEKALHQTAKYDLEFMRLLNQQFENSLFALCHGLTSLRSEDRNSLFYRGFFVGASIVFDTAKQGNEIPDLTCQMYDDLRKGMNDALIHGNQFALLALPNGELATVGAWDPNTGAGGKERVQRFFQWLELKAACYHPDVQITVLRTCECLGFEQLNVQLQQLQSRSSLRALCGVGGTIARSDLEAASGSPHKTKLSGLLNSLKHHLQARNFLNYQAAVNELEHVLLNKELLSPEEKRSVNRFLSFTVGVSLVEDASPDVMIRSLRQLGETVLLDKKQKDPLAGDLAEQVIQYIENHYMDDIGIGQIAHQLQVTANHLSMVFHKKAGVTFVKYVTNIRMQKAKELLLNTNLQVKQIAEQVGYYSTRHFTKLFTEHYDSYPSDYRKIHLGNVMK
ncbi:response regulator transcription factor [Paenibacillus aestuarii]|uniref:Response regulator n=1 Tax=Paenibacillus aestuarii TaxID=516965 RepID=A0ABW0K778_9BACL|nr:response regulator [Paenibacillus aestuarii]